MKANHTPEPWAVGKAFKLRQDIDAPGGDPTIGYNHWKGFVSCYSSDGEPEKGAAVAKANAERIVACVNAMAGRSPEAVSAAFEILQDIRDAALEVREASSPAIENGAVDNLFIVTMERLDAMMAALEKGGAV